MSINGRPRLVSYAVTMPVAEQLDGRLAEQLNMNVSKYSTLFNFRGRP